MNKWICIVLAFALLFGNITIVHACWPPPESFYIVSEDGSSVFHFTHPEFEVLHVLEECQESAQTGVYHNTTPLTLAYYLYFPNSHNLIFESCLVFSSDMQYLAWFPSSNHQPYVIVFFANGVIQNTYAIDGLVHDMSALTLTSIGYTWMGQPRRRFNSATGVLTLTTADAITYQFDITTGEILRSTYDSSYDLPYDSSLSVSYGILIIVLSVGIAGLTGVVTFLLLKRKCQV